MAEKVKKIGEIFSDYNTNSNIKHAQVAALNVIKKTNTLEVILNYDEYIEIKEIWFFEKFLQERFRFSSTDIKINYHEAVEKKPIKDEWKNIIAYMAHKYPLTKPMLLLKSDVEEDENQITIKMHIKGADFLRAKKTDQELAKVLKNLFGKDYKKEEKAIKEDIGVVLDNMFFPELLNAKDINNAMKDVYKNWDSELYFSYLKEFDLPDNKPLKSMSKGMRKKLEIVAAISHKPKLLILDEPTSGLDPVVRSEVLEIFQKFIENEEHSILLSTHITSDLEHIADEIIFIDKGKKVLQKKAHLFQRSCFPAGTLPLKYEALRFYIMWKKSDRKALLQRKGQNWLRDRQWL